MHINHHINLPHDRKVFFVSDSHLGAPNAQKSLEREKLLVHWLTKIQSEAHTICFLGDIFDFWFDYSKVIPKGYSRLFGKLAELSDLGIEMHFFYGNHDMWAKDYFTHEFNMQIHKNPEFWQINNKIAYVGHGDGLGPGDKGYKLLKKVFASPISRWLYACMHPRWGVGIAEYFSHRSRIANGNSDLLYLGESGEWQIVFAKEILLQYPEIDFFVFGHRHMALEIPLNEKTTYTNLGDWVRLFSYGCFDGAQMKIHQYPEMTIYSSSLNR